MSFLSRVRAALALPAVASGDVRRLSPYDDTNHLAHILAPDWFPNTGALTRSSAMRIPAVSRARRTVCNSIARIPLRAYTGDNLSALQPVWLDRTNGPVSPYHRMLWTVDDLFFYGWSAWAIERNTDRSVRAADRIPVDHWHIDPDTNQVIYTPPGGTPYPVAADAIVLIPGSDDGLLVDGAVAVGHAADLLRSATKAAENPSAYIELHQTNEAPITEEQARDMITKWAAARRGENGGVAFTSHGVEVREKGSYSNHLLVEGRNAAALDIARAAGLPGFALDASVGEANLTYQNAESKARDLIDYGLSAYMAPISARLGMDDVVPSGQAIKFDIEEFIGPKGTTGTPDDGSASTAPTPSANPKEVDPQ
ncbi:phage portal protein [Gordonia sp. CPCC 205333]|uniref:phage portal protein n=1 Tax=Gordonia sp. CPCC 205333 TaxID=3140790 RepID=UPI003AF36A03